MNTNSNDLEVALKELRFINRLISKISSIREINHIMNIIITELIKVTDSDQGVINLVKSSTQESMSTVVRANKNNQGDIPFKVDKIISGWVLDNEKILNVDDLNSDTRFTGIKDDMSIKSVLCCPMIIHNDIIGLTTLVRGPDKPSYSESLCRLVSIVANQSAQVLNNAMLLEELSSTVDLLKLSQEKLKSEFVLLKRK